MCSLFILCVLS
ncbi:hypothetical protein E2C01_101083 [Portunus trituberculatus]|uniref:Uncharacterized protein n=1 Tax=Portunus trituberculatus TaxID=210409 RepID=A0A5B7KEY8_PORTR|nr:hypothetical protein [Portunus trituberculatus]